jgi:chromosome segregation ATPase
VAIITFISDEGVETTYRVGEAEPDIVIGRHRTCNIRTSNQSVSRYHARIFFDGNAYYLQDNESVNGTFYENERLGPGDPVMLEDGKYLLCGNFELRFDYDDDDHARLDGGYEEALPEEDPDSTRFSDQYGDGYYDPPAAPPPPPPPPPPPQMPPPQQIPPPPPQVPPPPVPAYAEPPRQRSTGQVPPPMREDPVIEGLRADVTQRDKIIGELRGEVSALTQFLEDARNDPQRGQLHQDLDNARRAANDALSQGDELRRQVGQLEGRLRDADGQLEDLRRQLAEASGGGSRLEDERHIAALQSELQVLRDGLSAAQEKFEEARAGRRNAEELANLQRIRADTADGSVQLLKGELARLQQAHAVAQGETVSAEEYDAQVAAREEAEDRASKAERELMSLKAQAVRQQADAGSADAQLAELQVKLAAAEARALQAEAKSNAAPAPATGGDSEAELARLRIQLKAEKGRSAELQAELQTARAATSVPVADPAAVAAAQAQIDKLQAELAQARQAPAADSGEVATLRDEIARMQVGNKELQDTISANLKRIQRLTAQASASGDSDALQKQLTTLQAELNAAQAKVRELQAAPPSAAGGGADPKVVRMVSDLNGVVSSFRNDFAAVVDAFDQVRSDDGAERDEGMAQMTESLDNCSMRSQEIKNLLRDLKAAVEGN